MSVNDYIRITRDAKIISKEGDNPVVLELPQGLYGVITTDGKIVVPFGKYDLIEEFCLGVTRVKIGKGANGVKGSDCKWGIIDTYGNELLPVVYDNIWNYKAGPYDVLRLEKGEERTEQSISQLIRNQAITNHD